jgi:hypothetical protein
LYHRCTSVNTSSLYDYRLHAPSSCTWRFMPYFIMYEQSNPPARNMTDPNSRVRHIPVSYSDSYAGWSLSLFSPAPLWIYTDWMENMIFLYKLISLYVFVVRFSQQISSFWLWTDQIPSIVCEAHCIAVIPIELFLLRGLFSF